MTTTLLHRGLVLHAICWLSAIIAPSSMTAGAEPSPSGAVRAASADQADAGNEVITLFNGRDFTGWKTEGRWIIDQGAIYCDHRRQWPRSLTYQGGKLPAEFEFRFQWKTKPAAGERQAFDGAIGLGDGGTAYTDGTFDPPKVEAGHYARTICHVGGNEFHFRTQERRIPWANRPDPSSLFHFRGPDEVVREQRGWNEARIICRGTQIETWINGRRTLTLDAEKAKVDSPGMARPFDEWLTHKSAGLELRIEPGGCRAWYRDLTLRKLTD